MSIWDYVLIFKNMVSSYDVKWTYSPGLFVIFDDGIITYNSMCRIFPKNEVYLVKKKRFFMKVLKGEGD